jgi:hypothetical protein
MARAATPPADPPADPENDGGPDWEDIEARIKEIVHEVLDEATPAGDPPAGDPPKAKRPTPRDDEDRMNELVAAKVKELTAASPPEPPKEKAPAETMPQAAVRRIEKVMGWK